MVSLQRPVSVAARTYLDMVCLKQTTCKVFEYRRPEVSERIVRVGPRDPRIFRQLVAK